MIALLRGTVDLSFYFVNCTLCTMYTYSLFLRHFLFNFFHFSSGYWLVSLPNVIKCRRHLELYLLSIFVKGHGGKLFDKRVRFQKVSQIGGICLQGVLTVPPDISNFGIEILCAKCWQSTDFVYFLFSFVIPT